MLWIGLALTSARAESPSNWRATLGAYGEFLTHPGMTAGAEVRLWSRGALSLWEHVGAGAYVHPRHHWAAWIDARFAQRLTADSGLSGELLAGVGYLHTWAVGPLYVADGQGVARAGDIGRPHLMPSVALGGGWDLAAQGGPTLRPFLRLDVFWQAPFAGRALPHTALWGGASFALGRR